MRYPTRLSLHGGRSQPPGGDPGVALTASEAGLCACDASLVWFRQQVDGMVYIRAYEYPGEYFLVLVSLLRLSRLRMVFSMNPRRKVNMQPNNVV